MAHSQEIKDFSKTYSVDTRIGNFMNAVVDMAMHICRDVYLVTWSPHSNLLAR